MLLTAIVAAGLLAVGGTVAPPATTPATAIDWHACRLADGDALGTALDAAGAQCGDVTVPVDYRHPHGRTITVALARITATDPDKRRGILLLNPGGPGAGGMALVLLNTRMPAVAARYDLIGMDPRFVGRSSPITCDWHTDTFLRSAGPDRRTFDRGVTLMRQLADGCATGNLDLLPHASTRNTARDMDVIRRSLGEPKLSYLGYSYGTYLGAVYLQMFGAHADRVVLDSAVDPDVYGPALLSRTAPALRAALAHWAGWTAAHHDEYRLGTTRDAVLAGVDRINRAATRHPLTVGDYRIDAQIIPNLLLAGLYRDDDDARAQLADAVRVLDTATRGAPATPTPPLAEFLHGIRTGEGPATDRSGTPIVCADRSAPRQPDAYYRDIQAHRAAEPLFAPLTRNITPCAFWPVHGAEATTTVDNDAPALIVGADGDPVTPYPGQQALHRALTGSRMLTLRGGFGHTQYLAVGNSCLDDTVTRYLTGGPLPTHDSVCVVGS